VQDQRQESASDPGTDIGPDRTLRPPGANLPLARRFKAVIEFWITQPFRRGPMLRREFITLLGSAAMWPTGVQAQAPVKIARIGFLGLAPASAWSGEISALRMGLRELGYVEGKNIILDFA
jgi:aspartate aminotransferase-like enzyme